MYILYIYVHAVHPEDLMLRNIVHSPEILRYKTSKDLVKVVIHSIIHIILKGMLLCSRLVTGSCAYIAAVNDIMWVTHIRC